MDGVRAPMENPVVDVRKLLREAGIDPRRRWSQNFLVRAATYRRLVAAARFEPADVVLEIGAGLGVWTDLIAARAKHVFAFEVDPRLVEFLRRRFEGRSNITVVAGDFLKIDLHLFGPAVKAVGNIPYHITSPILEKLIESRAVKTALLMVQKEVAERVCAGPGGPAYGRLSLFVQYHFEPRTVFNVPPGDFFPPPKVTSSVLRLERRSRPPVEVPDEALFFDLVKHAFGHRRKTIQNNLKSWLGAESAARVLAEAEVSPRARAEELGFGEFQRLCAAVLASR